MTLHWRQKAALVIKFRRRSSVTDPSPGDENKYKRD